MDVLSLSDMVVLAVVGDLLRGVMAVLLLSPVVLAALSLRDRRARNRAAAARRAGRALAARHGGALHVLPRRHG